MGLDRSAPEDRAPELIGEDSDGFRSFAGSGNSLIRIAEITIRCVSPAVAGSGTFCGGRAFPVSWSGFRGFRLRIGGVLSLFDGFGRSLLGLVLISS